MIGFFICLQRIQIILDTDSCLELYGRRLRSLRINAGHNQSQVAAFIGASKSQYSRYEQGTCDLPARYLRSLCRLYGVSADFLLGLDEEDIQNTLWGNSMPVSGSSMHLAAGVSSASLSGSPYSSDLGRYTAADAALRPSNIHPAARRF